MAETALLRKHFNSPHMHACARVCTHVYTQSQPYYCQSKWGQAELGLSQILYSCIIYFLNRQNSDSPQIQYNP